MHSCSQGFRPLFGWPAACAIPSLPAAIHLNTRIFPSFLMRFYVTNFISHIYEDIFVTTTNARKGLPHARVIFIHSSQYLIAISPYFFDIIYNAEPRGIKSPARGLFGPTTIRLNLDDPKKRRAATHDFRFVCSSSSPLTNPTVHGFSKMRYFVHYTSDLNNDTIIETVRTASQYKSQTPISCK